MFHKALAGNKKNILFYNPDCEQEFAATLTGSGPTYQLVLRALDINDPNQQWIFTDDGYIVSVSQVIIRHYSNTQLIFSLCSLTKCLMC